jgi:short-subunit dehydrogenase
MPHTWFITGTNRGIGLEFARQLATLGDTVIAACRTPSKADALRAMNFRVLALDVTSEASCAAAAAELAGTPIDTLINNAGVSSQTKSITDITMQAMLDVFAVNSVSPLLVTKALLPNLKAGSAKRIINISSQLASIKNNTGGSTYAYRASKSALNQATRSLSNELAPQGFTCVAMHPGWVQTDMGGPAAPLTPAQAVTSMIKVFSELQQAHTGRFLSFDGSELPW